MAPLKVFAFDYTNDGGPMARALPGTFRQQGAMLMDALVADLGAVPGVDVCTMATLAGTSGFDTALAAQPFGERFAACVRAADAVWPLAPESGGLLESLSRHVLRGKRILLGSAPGAVRVASSKFKVARALADSGVPVVPTYRPHASLPDGQGAWVVKPDDGAGCLDARLFSDRRAALTWLRTSAVQGYVLQPFVAGKLGSLSLICCDGATRVLARNLERMAIHDNRFHFLGCTVNGLEDTDGALERLAQRVAAALPTLWGYVGVDIILTERGPVVLEVNPRLTAAYAGLHASIGCNPAGLVIDLLRSPAAMPAPATRRRAVSVDVASFEPGAAT